MDAIHFLNLEYFILLVYGIFTGATGSINVSQVPTQTLELLTHLTYLSLGVIFLMGIAIVYSYRRLHEVEHAGWHKRQHIIEKLHERHSVDTPSNSEWDHVVTMANSPQESDWRRAIMEADIMLGNLLASRGYRGTSIGDRLKDANPIQFTTLDLAWKAHKVRNQIAHEGQGFVLTEREAKATIDFYRRVFEEFDYI